MKHTPGPWTISEPKFDERYGHVGYDIYAGDLWIASVHGVHLDVPLDNISSNASLMTASPDLLDALQAAIQALDNSAIRGYPSSGATESMRAAIAKAKGETT